MVPTKEKITELLTEPRIILPGVPLLAARRGPG